jgi:glutamate synthase domain-containing protein 2
MIARTLFFLAAFVLTLAVLIWGSFWSGAYWLFLVIAPLILLGLYDMMQKDHAVLSIYPVIGHLRYLFESVRPEIQQYFVESDTNGQPVNREFRSLVYQRAKGVRDTRPFGTLFDVYENGYEWVNHSLSPKPITHHHPRVRFGGSECTKPYDSSPLNISAMSFGSLSRTAILALNKGAKEGGFAHNTGEGGISPHHLEFGGDLVWQIGTGYFGCRNAQGDFDADRFSEQAQKDAVKMIEVKLSQGAKPGHGGLLPAAKVTPEIAEIRNVPMGQDVLSPASHPAFSTPVGLLEFVKKLRMLSGGKPVGFKLCIGNKAEFLAICKAMMETGITPDFITVDGGEGGSGAAPVEFSNSVGMPLRDGLVFVQNALIGCGLRDSVKIIASGKVLSAFHLVRLLALGADTVNSARAMMFALGCIQSRLCNQNTCPTGITTQDPARYKALDVERKGERVAQYHASTIENLVDLVSSTGLNTIEELQPHHIFHRIEGTEVKNYAQLYPGISDRCLLSESTCPPDWKADWSRASASTF